MRKSLQSLVAGAALGALAFAGSAVAQQSVKIGFITTLSGPAAIIRKDMTDSVELALDHLGHKRGGRPVEVFYGDDQFKPEVGVQLAEELLKKNQGEFIGGLIFCER